MERDTRDTFEALTRGIEEELSARREHELSRRRRAVPYLLLHVVVGVTATTVVGIASPPFGVLMFLGLTWVTHRILLRIVPDTDR
ncbi:MAG: hypothetical protein KJS90_04645 [Acidobacteria bacterium]|nr:hypothetical protein [Acidobacteriota bacterium]